MLGIVLLNLPDDGHLSFSVDIGYIITVFLLINLKLIPVVIGAGDNIPRLAGRAHCYVQQNNLPTPVDMDLAHTTHEQRRSGNTTTDLQHKEAENSWQTGSGCSNETIFLKSLALSVSPA